MEPTFWKQRWQENKIGFHLDEVNPYLMEHWPRLGISAPARLLVPLCGKSVDMSWLAKQGYEIEAVEISELAVRQFFHEQALPVDIRQVGEWTVYCSIPESGEGHIRIWCGNYFEMSPSMLGQIDAVYDRAALIALPETMRAPYVSKLLELTGPVPQFLITLDYEQEQMAGPPFSVPLNEINQLYGGIYGEHTAPDVVIDVLPSHGHFAARGLEALSECVYLFQPSQK